MSGKKIITVIGATGAQGGGVIKALLAQGNWSLRALSRQSNGAAAQKLKAQGVEVFEGDMNSKDDLAKAFKGAHGVFAVTTPFGGQETDEYATGKLLVDVAKEQRVDHFVFSSLANVEKITNGSHHVPHFTNKARVDDYIQSVGLPSTSVQIGAYYENFQTMMAPKPNADGGYDLSMCIPPDSPFAIASVEDLGLVVSKVLQEKDKFLGKKIIVAGDYLSPNQIAQTFSKVWNKPVKVNYIPREVYSKFPFPAAAEIADMFDFYDKFGFAGEKVNGRDIHEGKKLVPSLSSFEQWVAKAMPQPPAPQQH